MIITKTNIIKESYRAFPTPEGSNITQTVKLHIEKKREAFIQGADLFLSKVTVVSCNADCPDVKYGNCCHPSKCMKEYETTDEYNKEPFKD